MAKAVASAAADTTPNRGTEPMRVRVRRSGLARALAVATVVAATAAPAFAESPAERIAGRWIEQLRGTGATVTTGALTYTAADDRLQITDLLIVPPGTDGKPDGEIRVPSVVVVGLADRPDGGFAIKSVSVGAIEGGNADRALTIHADGLEGRDIVIPGLAGLSFDPGRPMAGMVPALRRFATARIASLKVGRMGFHDGRPGKSGDFDYGGLSITGLADGKLETFRSEPMTIAGDSAKDGHIAVRLGVAEALGIDYGFYADAFDDTTYTKADTDRAYRMIERSASIEGFSVETPKVKISLARFGATDVRMRRFDRPIAAAYDELLADPAKSDSPEAASVAVALLRAFAIGSYSYEGFSISGMPELERGLVGRVAVTDVSSEGIGEFAVEGVDFAGDQGTFRLARFAIGKIGFPAYDDVERAFRAAAAGNSDVDPVSVIPSVGHLGIDGAAFDAPGKGRMLLDHFAIDLDGFIRAVPTKARVVLTGLVVPTSFAITDADRESIERFGYDKIGLSAEVALGWNATSRDLSLDTLAMTLADGGTVKANAVLGNVPQSAFERPQTAQAALAGATLKAFTAEYADASLFRRFVAAAAKGAGTTPDSIVAGLVDRAGVSLGILPDPALRRSYLDALGAFAKAPQSLKAVARIGAPIPLMQVVGTAAAAPQQIPGLLGIEVAANR